MESTENHIPGDQLRELYERTGLSIPQFARLFDLATRTMHSALNGMGIQTPKRVEQYERLREATAELELEAISELTPAVAFNSPKLRELMLQKFLKSSSGRSVYHSILSEIPRAQKIQLTSFDLWKMSQSR